MTMGAVPYINDLVGGVPVTVLDDFSGIDDSLVEGETITLKGEQALHYVRIRGGLEDSSNLNRMKRQQQYLESMAEQIGKLDENFSVSPQQISTIQSTLFPIVLLILCPEWLNSLLIILCKKCRIFRVKP